MKKGHTFYNILLVACFVSQGAQAGGYFGVGITMGSGYGSYYPAAGGAVGGYGYGNIGGACGAGCRPPPAYAGGCQYNPYSSCMGGGMGGGGYGGGMGGMPGMPGMPGTPGMGGMPGVGGIPMGGGFAFPMLPPPQPYLPPHLAMGGMPGMGGTMPGWGGGYGSYPMPGMAPTPGCIPTGAGYQNQPMYPVAGGPVLNNAYNPYGGAYATGASTGLNRGVASGNVIIDMRSRNAWEIPDTGEIVFNAGLGMSSMLTNVTPVGFPRNGPTLIPPGWFNSGDRNPDFWARPTPH